MSPEGQASDFDDDRSPGVDGVSNPAAVGSPNQQWNSNKESGRNDPSKGAIQTDSRRQNQGTDQAHEEQACNNCYVNSGGVVRISLAHDSCQGCH